MGLGINLANTTFSTGADERLATVDTYKISTSDSINNKPNLEEELDNKELGRLKATTKPGLGLKVPTGKSEGLQLKESAVKDGILSSSTGLLAGFKSLPKDLQDSIAKTNGFNSIDVAVGSLTKTIKDADLGTVKGIVTLIKGVSNNKNFIATVLDKKGLTNLATNIIKDGARMGIPSVYKAFTEGINNKEIMNAVTGKLLPEILTTGNVDLMKDIADGASVLGINKIYPQFTSEFSRLLNIPVKTKAKDKNKILTDIDYSFTKMNPNWKTKKRGTKSSVNLAPVSKASPSMLNLLKTKTAGIRVQIPPVLTNVDTSNQLTELEKLSAMCTLANSAPEPFKPPEESLREDYPYIA